MGRPSRPRLSRDLIARAALDLLDAEGPDGVVMRQLAQRLGVRAPSLYNHVSGQDEVIDLLHDLIDQEIDTSMLAGDAPDDLAAFVRSYRAAYVRHRHAIPLVGRRPIRSETALKLYDELTGYLTRVGIPPDEVLRVVGLIDYVVLGCAVQVFSSGFEEPAEHYRGTYPSLAAALAAADRDQVDDEAFDLAVRQLLHHLGTVTTGARG